MEVKKSPEANLDKKKNIFFYTGMVITLSLILLLFEWTPKETKENVFGDQGPVEIEDEIIPITRQEVKPPPPPPPKVTTQIEIVDDEEEIEDEPEIDDSEADEQTETEVAPIEEEEEETDEVFQFAVIEDKPEFPGGMAGLLKYIATHTKYPQIAKENGISGKVYVQFVIGKDGKVTDVKVVRGRDPYLDKEAVRVVKSLPAWKPGKQRGKPVKVSYIVPINFKLQ